MCNCGTTTGLVLLEDERQHVYGDHTDQTLIGYFSVIIELCHASCMRQPHLFYAHICYLFYFFNSPHCGWNVLLKSSDSFCHISCLKNNLPSSAELPRVSVFTVMNLLNTCIKLEMPRPHKCTAGWFVPPRFTSFNDSTRSSWCVFLHRNTFLEAPTHLPLIFSFCCIDIILYWESHIFASIVHI